MLVLSRKKEEGIEIEVPPGFTGTVRMKVVEIRGDKVRLGIQAPPEVRIDRDEVGDSKRREKQLAIQTKGSAEEQCLNT